MNRKLSIIILVLTLLSAGCNPFSKTLPGGLVKSVNGGVDWQFANTIKDNATVSLANYNISKLAFDPKNQQTIFAGTYTAGLFKSEDAGATWTNILSKIFVYDVAISPLDSKIIYAAGFFADHGRVLKTTDGGASWTQIYNEASINDAVRAMALNPQDPNQIMIGTATGSLIKSADGGLSWQLVKSFNDRINKLVWQNGGIYLVLQQQGLFKSTGFADTFTELTLSLSKIFDSKNYSYNSKTVSYFNQVFVDYTSPELIYLTTDQGLYKTVDEGKTWVLQGLPVKPEKSVARAIAISRVSSNIVYASVEATVYKSVDGGGSWQTQSINTAGFVNFILVDPVLPQIVYAGIYTAPQ